MRQFMDKDFLLENETAKELFHKYANKMPVIDYHCHINPQDIAEDIQYENITQAWLYADHYKWRALRSNGIDEKYITGDSSDYEKFEKLAETMPKLIGNPLYHWTHLELQKYFGINSALCKENAKEVWDLCNSKLASMSVRSIIKDSHVKAICTTDDPIDSLQYHKAIRDDDTFDVQVLPAFRPDKVLGIEKDEFVDYLQKLSEASSIKINNLSSLKNALSNRLDHFDLLGCKASDHGLEYVMCNIDTDDAIEKIFEKRLNHQPLTNDEVDKFKTTLLLFLGQEYSKRDWVMQIHYGVTRNNNLLMFNKLGPDTGFDAISTKDSYQGLSQLLDALNSKNSLPKTILYSLNPNDNAMIGSLVGCFQDTRAQGKIQHGSAWWFNDTKEGMIAQIKGLSSLSVLGNFIGMLTDSRSFLSYTRHEYFRRILCNLIGTWVENGEYPNDEKMLKQLVEDISYNNTKKYFGFNID
ncbi:MAG: glucuronate isomerase [Clostridiales bacterium]|nr:glucuronate isomerase [Clostridiales bacterium]